VNESALKRNARHCNWRVGSDLQNLTVAAAGFFCVPFSIAGSASHISAYSKGTELDRFLGAKISKWRKGKERDELVE